MAWADGGNLIRRSQAQVLACYTVAWPGRGAQLRVEPLNTCGMQIHAFKKFYERLGLSVGILQLVLVVDLESCLCANNIC